MSKIVDQPFKIIVSIPTHEHVHALFAYDLAQMMTLTTSLMPPDEGHSLGLAMNIGTYIHNSRTELLQQALETKSTHVLWLDSDMRFPADSLIRLLKHRQAVVGINYSKRRIPAEFVAVERMPTKKDLVGRFLYTGRESEGLAEVQSMGFGMVLMETAALVNLPDPKHDPWFWFAKTEDGRTIGEDVYFCTEMLRKRLKLRLFVDQDLSWQCEHMGSFGYKCAHAADEFNELVAKES